MNLKELINNIIDNVYNQQNEIEPELNNIPQKRKTYIVYKVENKLNGKIYIGRTTLDYNMCLERHKTRSKYEVNNKFHKALNHFGEDNFKWRKLHQTSSDKKSKKIQEFYIDKYNTIEDGYNSSKGRKFIKERD